MKKRLTILLLVFTGNWCRAQTFEELFRQEETSKEYLIQQIAAFKVYLGHVQKGYDIAQKGFTTISNIKRGDYNLHRDFFGSLKGINPKVSRYARVSEIIALQIKIVQVYKAVNKQMRSSRGFDAKEVNYISSVFEKVLDDCSAIIAELTMIITPDALEMKDDERLKRIHALYTSIQENYTFANSFKTDVKHLALQRIKEENDVQTSRVLSGIKNK